MREHEANPFEHLMQFEMDEARDPNIGDGTPETAPHREIPVGLLTRQPAAVIGSIVATIDAVLIAAVPLPEWLTTVLVAFVTVAGALGIRARVTPVARPRDNDGDPLTVD